MFAANGADYVATTNITDCISDEPLPKNVEFFAGDVGDIGFDKKCFDIVYGVAILEHIPDLEKCVAKIDDLLRPDGVAYLQGCPLWAGSHGHHVWVLKEEGDYDSELTPEIENRTNGPLFSFVEKDKNPIPHWAHLVLTPDSLTEFLTKENVSESHARRIINFVYNVDGTMIGCCSNFKSASEIIKTFQTKFIVDAERIPSAHPNEYFTAARKKYSYWDLQTHGLMLWLKPKSYMLERVREPDPKVSVIVPFYKVEDYLGECIESIIRQDYKNIEIILVDDASPDGSRGIAQRFAAKDSRIRVLTHEKNEGLGPARNTGVHHATGFYVFFLDSDDLLHSSQAIGKLVSAAQSHSNCPVVVGGCVRLMANGKIQPVDHIDDRGGLNKSGGVVHGVEAFLAGVRLPNAYYLPPRAWGALIERTFYENLMLDFPSGEHEDLVHTPFLYFLADNVLYVKDIVVTYRYRDCSISNARWTPEMVRRYGDLWRNFKSIALRRGLENYLGDCAFKFIYHLIWRMRNNSFDDDSRTEVLNLVGNMFQDVENVTYKHEFYRSMNSVRKFVGGTFRRDKYYEWLTKSLPEDLVLDYYRNHSVLGRLSFGQWLRWF